ncbi:MAG: hypothetical protein WA152_02975 [Microgenomates group bacterium]|jgi:hypothetical protein
MNSEILSVKPTLLPLFLKAVVQPSLLTPNAMKSGREWKNIKLRPREAVGLFLVFAVGQFIDPDNTWTIGSDPESQDGVVVCVDGEKKGDAVAVEQVYVPNLEIGEISDLIKNRIEQKTALGIEYAKDRHLVIFCDKSGSLDLSKVSEFLENQESFMSYWIIARIDAQSWNYLVATPKTSGDPREAYRVKIENDFSDWNVEILSSI